jgi:hypothetical protein
VKGNGRAYVGNYPNIFQEEVESKGIGKVVPVLFFN